MKEGIESAEFIVHGDADCLEDTRKHRGCSPSIDRFNASLQSCRRRRLLLRNHDREPARRGKLAIHSECLGELLLLRSCNPGSSVHSPTLIKPEIQRSIETETESTIGIIEVRRADAEVCKKDIHRSIHARRKITEVRMTVAHTTVVRLKLLCSRIEVTLICVNANQNSIGVGCLQESTCMSCEP